MAYSYIRYTGNGTQTDFTFAFPYFSTANISVTVDGTAAPFTWVNSSTVKITTAPALGAVIFIQRTTPKDITPVNFVDGSVLLEADLDTLALFSLYAAQESIDEANKAIKLNSSGNWEAQGNRINNVADPVNDQDVATKKWSETGMTAQLSIATNQATAAGASATAAAGSAAASSASASSSAASASTATTKAAEASSSAGAAATSATNAAGSATTATNKAAEAATSATTATTKASEAASSATTASTAAGSANTSATAAAGSATAAANSASGAAASATTATTKASEASSSATSAASSASTATGAASTATTKASEASSSATAAAGSATSASTSAGTATAQATIATTKAAEAVVSASDSAASAVSAASSAASAAALLDNFDDRYLGSKAADPSVDNDGDPLQLGALYSNSTTGKMRVYTASGWIDASSASVATLATFNFTATGGQTSFSGADIASQTLTYTIGALFVTLNGIDLKNGTDYTATTGSSIVLASGAVAGDELRVYAFGSFLVADTYTRAQADAGFVAKDGSGNVGIGTATPSARLHVKSSNGMLVTEATSSNPSLKLVSAANNRNWEVLSFATNAGEFVIYDGIANANRLVIDTGGRVTTPAQPAFRAGGTAPDNTLVFSANAKLTFLNKTSLNRGNNYDEANARFTAPVSGVYFFSTHFWVDGGSPASLSIRVNGGQPKGGNGDSCTVNEAGAGDPQKTIGMSIVLALAAGDHVEVFTRNTGWIGYAGHSWWQGYLIG